MKRRTCALAVLLAPLGFLSLGCTENEIILQPFDNIAVVSGDFDAVERNLGRLDVAHTVYEGFISAPAYDDDVDPEQIALKSETLFTYVDADEDAEIDSFDAVFVNSGARGFGEVQWNGIEDDDAFVADPEVIERVRTYVEGNGRTLVVSDWSYDLVEAVWPEKVKFYQDESGVYDAAQVAVAGQLTAQLQDEGLKAEVGSDTMSVHFDYSDWTFVESVADDVEVFATGDVEYKVSESEGYATAEGVPLLLSFEAGRGQVIFTSFHWNSQTPGLSDALLTAMVDRLDPGNASESDESTDTGDSGA